jgi:hypothetical protein
MLKERNEDRATYTKLFGARALTTILGLRTVINEASALQLLCPPS